MGPSILERAKLKGYYWGTSHPEPENQAVVPPSEIYLASTPRETACESLRPMLHRKTAQRSGANAPRRRFLQNKSEGSVEFAATSSWLG